MHAQHKFWRVHSSTDTGASDANSDDIASSDESISSGTSQSSSSTSSATGSRSSSCQESNSAIDGRRRVLRWLCVSEEPNTTEYEFGTQGGIESIGEDEFFEMHAVNIEVRQRSGKKMLTILSGLPSQLHGFRVDFAQILKAMKCSFKTNGTLRVDRKGAVIFQLQGDCWRVVRHFLVCEGLAEKRCIQCRGMLGEGLAGLSGLMQLETSLATAYASVGRRRRGPIGETVDNAPRRSARAFRSANSAESARDICMENPSFEAAVQSSDHGSWNAIRKELQHIATIRGRRHFSPAACVQGLQQLLNVAEAHPVGVFGPNEVLTVLGIMVRMEFDATGPFRRMLFSRWQQALSWLARALTILRMHPDAVLIGDTKLGAELVCGSNAVLDTLWLDQAGVSEPAKLVSSSETSAREQDRSKKTSAVLARELLRLAWELWESFCCASSDSSEEGCARYAVGLMDLLPVLAQMHEHLHMYYSAAVTESNSRVAACILEVIYNMEESITCRLLKEREASSDTWIQSLHNEVCEHGDATARTRATLQLAYHHALHDRYREGESLLVLSGAMDQAATQDIPMQILCNCAIAQLGLCAFRAGKLAEARMCLSGLCIQGRMHVLLGQGARWDSEVDQSSRRYPRLNVSLVVAAHCIATMLLEAPTQSLTSTDNNYFWYELKQFEQRRYRGPPENSLECVFAAAEHLKCFNWEMAAALIDEALVRAQYGCRCTNAGDVGSNPRKRCGRCHGVDCAMRATLLDKVKIAALQVYLITSHFVYHSLELSKVAAMFDLGERAARSIINQMMLEDKLSASWDEYTQVILMQECRLEPMQDLAFRLADHARAVAEINNRRLSKLHLEVRHGSSRLALLPKRRLVQLQRPQQPMPPCPQKEQQWPSIDEMKNNPGTRVDSRNNGQADVVASRQAAKKKVQGSAASKGRQSPFRKSLINLNKAVAKWLALVKQDELSMSVVEDRIRNSAVLQHLRDVHGADFQETKFVCDILARAGASLCGDVESS